MTEWKSFRLQRGFRLRDGIAVLVVFLIYFVLISSVFRPPWDPSNAKRARCWNNLKAIGTGVAIYQKDNGGRFPMLRDRPATNAGVNSAPTDANACDVEYGQAREDGTIEDWSALGDQAMQNVWLLIQSGDLKERVFKCPADNDWDPRKAETSFGWTSPFQYSYGMQWPYAYDADGRTNAAPFAKGLDSSVAMFADMCPDLAEGATQGVSYEMGPEPMHGKLGFNFLAGDTPQNYQNKENSLAGYAGDDIYTGGPEGKAGAMPGGPKDSSIALSGRMSPSQD